MAVDIGTGDEVAGVLCKVAGDAPFESGVGWVRAPSAVVECRDVC